MKTSITSGPLSAPRATLLRNNNGKVNMHPDAEQQQPTQLDGQTSINDLLAATPAITPVELREPSDAELAIFLEAQTE